MKIALFMYVALLSLLTIIGIAMAMIILRGVHSSDEGFQRMFWYFKAIIIFCGSITTLVGIATAVYIMLH